jgi:uncharacterized protein YlbG (UPF0298 family)
MTILKKKLIVIYFNYIISLEYIKEYKGKIKSLLFVKKIDISSASIINELNKTNVLT